MYLQNASWLYSLSEELSSVASSIVSLMFLVIILSSRCAALEPNAPLWLKTQAVLESILDDMTHVLGEWTLSL